MPRLEIAPETRFTEHGDLAMTDFKRDGSHLSSCPPVEKWDDWVEFDPEAWPRRVEKHYQLGSHHLLQLRIGVRAAGLRRQGNGRDRQV